MDVELLPSLVGGCFGVKPDVTVDVKQSVVVRERWKVSLVQRMLKQGRQSRDAASSHGSSPARLPDQGPPPLLLRPRRRSAPSTGLLVAVGCALFQGVRREVGSGLVAEVLQNPQCVLVRPARVGRPAALLPPALSLAARVVSTLTAAARAVRPGRPLLQLGEQVYHDVHGARN